MPHTAKKLEKSQIELTITVAPAEYQKHLERAAQKISERAAIKGFRPGKAPYEMIKKEIGEMKIMQEALEAIVQASFYDAIKSEGVETVGMPQISLEKMAPDNDLTYKATVALMPKVKLSNIKKVSVKKEVKKVEDKDIEKTLDSLRETRAKEVIKTGKAENNDMLLIDLEMFLDKIPVEGGQARDYRVYLGEDHYVPGFNQQAAGLQKGDEKEFALDFPPNHYQKNLAGKKVNFKIKVKDVFERQLPPADDEFAKILGQESFTKLQELMRRNLTEEAKKHAEQKYEIELLDNMVAQSEFEEIPEVLLNAERQKMFYELKSDLEHHGITIEKYLEDIKKTKQEMFEEFRAQAEKRAKAALVSRQIAKENNITAGDEEIDKEIKMMEDVYKDNKERVERLKFPEVRNAIAMLVQNRKTIEWMKRET
ncbi:MAG: trigger factor [Candidatus Magasanikbacteria bacterium RIFCSPLOWO2_12_FULL_43_12]|uniref:Trigger factor n=1 Tax=Candidatus Magasanikbacteria bacterium RIFCSPLOWO2_12_FULL_43_12 TaxID=1798692 RepID=A0A1F6MW30_9BACT|nr:MAG: trigger factor [Candidatus Magasanikbacteria bacterium RIFCSPLOWO2_12_FULL_43_12]